jgi:hypothetical protein
MDQVIGQSKEKQTQKNKVELYIGLSRDWAKEELER